MNRTFAAAAVGAAIIAAPAGAQEKHDWVNRRVPTAAEAWRWLEDGPGGARERSSDVSGALGFPPHPEEERDALAEGLAELVVRHAGREGSDTVVWQATRALYWAAVLHDAISLGATDFPNGEVDHRASFEALRRIFEVLEPFPLCYVSIGLEVRDPDHQPPWCEVSPPDSPWCMAGRALYSAEVDRAIGQLRRDAGAGPPFARPNMPPEVRGLSEEAAKWWSRCWDGRIMGG